jgi:8-oxo-dGTP pyrophosphatase MutT (NUDIX family)
MKTIFYNDFDYRPDENLNPDSWNAANGFCFDDEGKVAIVFEIEKGEWNLPGGGKEMGETPEQTFIREVKEEAQAEATEIEYFHSVYTKTFDEDGKEISDPESKIGFRFICKLKNIEEFEPNKIVNSFKCEIDERKFVTLEELPNYITWLKDAENGRESFEILKQKISKVC